MIEKVLVGSDLAALIIREGAKVKESTFFSPSDLFLQASIFKRPKNFEEKPHYHKKIERTVTRVEQFLYLLEGVISFSFYDRQGRLVARKRVSKGDGILLIEGVHSLKISKGAKAISIKQGPFLGDTEDKIPVKAQK